MLARRPWRICETLDRPEKRARISADPTHPRRTQIDNENEHGGPHAKQQKGHHSERSPTQTELVEGHPCWPRSWPAAKVRAGRQGRSQRHGAGQSPSRRSHSMTSTGCWRPGRACPAPSCRDTTRSRPAVHPCAGGPWRFPFPAAAAGNQSERGHSLRGDRQSSALAPTPPHARAARMYRWIAPRSG
jgi:hypothetical protein